MPSMSSASLRAHLALITALSFTSLFLLYKSRRLRSPRPQNPNPKPRRGKLFFFSQTNTSKALASRLLYLLNSSNSSIPFDLVDPQSYEPEDLVNETLVLFVASTWEDGKPPPNGEFLARWLAESAEDFRVGSLVLSRCDFAVFGSGAYEGSFNKVARNLSLWMRALGGKELVPVMESDVDRGEVEETFGVWSEKVIGVLKRGGKDGVVSDGFDGFEEEVDDEDEDEEEGGAEDDEVDMEDIAWKGPSGKMGAGVANGEDGSKEKSLGNGDDGAREMVTPVIWASLQKLVGARTTAAEVEVKRQKNFKCGAPPESVRKCTICNVMCSSDKMFALHLAGEKHAQKAFGIPPNALKPKRSVRRKFLHLTKKVGHPAPSAAQPTIQASTGLISFVSSLHCEVCKIDCNSPQMLNIHRHGKKHIRNLQKLQESVRPKLANVLAKKSNPQVNSSATRNKKANEQARHNSVSDLETKKQKVLNGGASADGVVCSYCNVVCNSQLVYSSHIAEKKHIAIMNKQQ